jgi:hypothetical protein
MMQGNASINCINKERPDESPQQRCSKPLKEAWIPSGVPLQLPESRSPNAVPPQTADPLRQLRLYSVLFEIGNSHTVTALAVRHQREDDHL